MLTYKMAPRSGLLLTKKAHRALLEKKAFLELMTKKLPMELILNIFELLVGATGMHVDIYHLKGTELATTMSGNSGILKSILGDWDSTASLRNALGEVLLKNAPVHAHFQRHRPAMQLTIAKSLSTDCTSMIRSLQLFPKLGIDLIGTNA